MNTLLRKSLIATLVATQLLISHGVLGSDETDQYYRIMDAWSPTLWLDNVEVGKTDWFLKSNSPVANGFNLMWGSSVDDGYPFIVETGAPDWSLYINSIGKIGLGVNDPVWDLHIGGSGDVLLENGASDWLFSTEISGFALYNMDDSFTRPLLVEADAPTNSLYIDSTGKIGLGVANPRHDLHVGGSGDVLLDNGSSVWLLYTSDVGLEFHNRDFIRTMPLYLGANAPDYSLVVEQTSGDIGVGILKPTAPLHVRRSNGTARIFVEEINTTAAKRTLYHLANNGEIRFTMRTTDSSVPIANRTWDFLMATDGFNITRVGSGGAEMLVGNNGSVRMGNKNGGAGGFDPTFYLDTLGNLTVDGAMNPGSDVNSKENIKPIDKFAVLAKLEKLPVTGWNFIGDNHATHVGPMAQDFHAAFGLGVDDKHIGVLDASGVTIASIQALLEKHNQLLDRHDQLQKMHNQSVTQKDAEISELKQRLTRLETQQERLSQLEELLRDLTVKREVAQR